MDPKKQQSALSLTPPLGTTTLSGLPATLASTLVCAFLGLSSLAITHGLNSTSVHGGGRFMDAHGKAAARGAGLITASNHSTRVDDPGAIAPLLPLSWLFTPHKLRYTLCAVDRCFRSTLVGAVLTAGRVLPVARGAGPNQPLMDDVVAKLNEGAWLHMFPTGTRSEEAGQLAPCRPGVGRLIADAVPTPVVLPVYHRGLEALQPRGTYWPLGVGHRIDIFVGDEVDVATVLADARARGLSPAATHAAVAAAVGEGLAKAKAGLEALDVAAGGVMPSGTST